MSRSFTIIAAMTKKQGIGFQNQLPWKRFKKDLEFFKRNTIQQTIIMGRKTWDSLNCRPLPNRHNIVLTRDWQNLEKSNNQIAFVSSLEQALNRAKTEEIFVIGGQKLYENTIHHPSCQRLLITHANIDLPSDTYFPNIHQQDYQETEIIPGKGTLETHQGEKHNIDYEIVEYSRNSVSNIFFPLSVSGEDEQRQSFTSIYEGEKGYLRAVDDIIENGETRYDRTHVGTQSLFGLQMRFDLKKKQFPLLTTKKMFTKGIIAELLWFLSGSTDTKRLSKQGVHIWDGNTSREFLDNNGFTDRPEGDMGPSYSFQFRHAGAKYKTAHIDYTQDPHRIDQVNQVIQSIIHDPHSRRHIINLWNVPDIPKMSLPPCLFLYQFYVSQHPKHYENPTGNKNYLNLSLYQRSADMGLGVPFNIASASLFTYMIAEITGLQPGELIHHIGDAHIYTDHINPLKKQIQREPRPFPQLHLSHQPRKIEDFYAEDFKIKGYYPYPGLKMKMAI